MTAAGVASRNAITLKGSTEVVTEFFSFGINSILYQRGIYPPETFKRIEKYGVPLLVTRDDVLKDYLEKILAQVKEWLMNMTVQKLVVVIKGIDSKDVLERWQFDVQCDKSILTDGKPKTKEEGVIQKEIRDVIRQIVASVTFLPMIDEPCSFEILVYTDKDLEVPEQWGESGPCQIMNSEEVRLRSFSTVVHKVDTMVAYKISV